MTANTSSSLDRWFHLSARGSDVKTEVRGGFVTFITMAYIVVLNPLIIGTAKDVNGNFPGGGQDVGIGFGRADQPLVGTEAGDPAGRVARQGVDRAVEGEAGRSG